VASSPPMWLQACPPTSRCFATRCVSTRAWLRGWRCSAQASTTAGQHALASLRAEPAFHAVMSCLVFCLLCWACCCQSLLAVQQLRLSLHHVLFIGWLQSLARSSDVSSPYDDRLISHHVWCMATATCSWCCCCCAVLLCCPAGLGPAADTCAIISDQINVGDGHTVCGAEEIKRRTTNTGYTVSGLARQ
jgi:hypothetical protein